MTDRRCSIQRRHQQQLLDVHADHMEIFLGLLMAEWAHRCVAHAVWPATTASDRDNGHLKALYTPQITLWAQLDD